MDWQDEAGVGRRAQSLTQALDEVERFPPPEATLQTQHYITEARGKSGNAVWYIIVWHASGWAW